MELSEFKQVINNIPAIYDNYDICVEPTPEGYFVGDVTIDDESRTITLDSYDQR